MGNQSHNADDCYRKISNKYLTRVLLFTLLNVNFNKLKAATVLPNVIMYKPEKKRRKQHICVYNQPLHCKKSNLVVVYQRIGLCCFSYDIR